MSTIIAQAKHEGDGWRGQMIAPDGRVVTRTVNLYATSDKAIDGARRLWSFLVATGRHSAADAAPEGNTP
jgi:hypothetical protein